MARKRTPVTDDELRSIVMQEIQNADGFQSSQLSDERGENMDYYLARPFGNELDGRSQVVSTDVRDTVEWIMPTIVRIFTSGEDVVEFEPETPQDINGAKQATEYVNFIWNRDNRGFLNFYSWFKDALLQKNGRIKIWWDDTPKQTRERYMGLPDDAFAILVADDDVEVAEHTEHKEESEQLVPDPQNPGQLIPQPVEIVTHDVVITRTQQWGCVKVVPVPPEEFLISKDARCIGDARFVGHRRRRTFSDMREEGYSEELLDSVGSDETSIAIDTEEIKRNTVENIAGGMGSTATTNRAMRQMWVTEGYLKVDVDGDGIAEMRKVTVAGSTYQILSNEAWDMDRPFADITPIIMPHRYHGLAIADLIKDIQLIKSTILRQYLDGLYLRTNQREMVVEKDIIEPSEVLSSAPGRKIRIKGPGPAIFPIETPDVGSAALQGLEYIDSVMENRTGVSQRTQGLGANVLHDTALGERMLMSAAMGKIELIARVFAETGVRDAFRMILKLISKYQDKPRTIRLEKNQWATMDPSQWNSDMDMTVRVGMGVGDKDQQLQHAMMLFNIQQQVAPFGGATPQNFMNTAEMMVNAMGQKGVERFFTLPPPPDPSQQKPDPKMVEAQGKVQVAQAVGQSKVQIETAKAKAHIALTAQKNQADAALEAQKTGAQTRLEAFKAQQQAALQQFQVEEELRMKQEAQNMQHALDASNAAVEQSMRVRMSLPTPGNP